MARGRRGRRLGVTDNPESPRSRLSGAERSLNPDPARANMAQTRRGRRRHPDLASTRLRPPPAATPGPGRPSDDEVAGPGPGGRRRASKTFRLGVRPGRPIQSLGPANVQVRPARFRSGPTGQSRLDRQHRDPRGQAADSESRRRRWQPESRRPVSRHDPSRPVTARIRQPAEIHRRDRPRRRSRDVCPTR